jgi:Glu-tRNA(Gln) amidotransferase subunit E-like FAD-binding protein
MVGEFRKIDYEQLGFKSGLEIHQQLDTKKLFCNCPSLLRQDEPDFVVRRKLHAVAGESGEIDIAAKHEAEKEKNFSYEGYDTTCLVELDEMPPYEINQDALKIALQISLLLNATILPIGQIMRKTVINGSNTSGFQRTVLIARDGWIVTKNGRVNIDSICLEEDAAREIRRGEKDVTFRLDRLGIPLIEIATSPDMRNAEHVKEVALYIGQILRSCKVKRGIGTIRQDVNVSLKESGYSRVEIKGFQEPAMMIKTIENEIQRQQILLKTGKTIFNEVRNALPTGETEFLRPMPGSARMYPETDLPLLKISRDLINEVKKNLPQLREDAEKELKKEGLTDELIKLVLEGYLEDFKELLKIYPQEPMLVAKMLTIWRQELSTKLKKDMSQINKIISLDVLETLLQGVKKGNVDKNHIKPVFNELMEGVSLKDITAKKVETSGNAEEKILKIIKNKPGLSANAYMGLVMKEMKGKVNASEAMGIITKLLNK